MEGKKMIITRATIPGWLKSPDAAQYLGLTESQFRKVHPKIKSIQQLRHMDVPFPLMEK